MATTTIQFNNGNPFNVGPGGVHSQAQTLPSTVNQVDLNLLDPNGDWVNPANSGNNFVFGIEYSPDGGTTWLNLISNGTGEAVGSLDKQGGMPQLTIARSNGISEAFGMQCRAFASCTPGTISIAATAVVTH